MWVKKCEKYMGEKHVGERSKYMGENRVRWDVGFRSSQVYVGGKIRPYFGQIRRYFIPYVKET